MDINSTSNISRINLNQLKNTFEASKPKSVQTEDFKDDDIKLMDKKIHNSKVDVEDIQKYANYMGETLSIDDINYGLMYGRSVIADYIA